MLENLHVRFGGGNVETCRKVTRYVPALHIGNNFYQVYISLKGETIECREEEVESIDMTQSNHTSLLSVSSRINSLLKAELEAVDYAILETIQRSLYLTARQLMYLEVMEKDYGVSQ